jgi:hypothetical protein
MYSPAQRTDFSSIQFNCLYSTTTTMGDSYQEVGQRIQKAILVIKSGDIPNITTALKYFDVPHSLLQACFYN